MDKLFESVRSVCSPQIWSRAVQLARGGTIDGRMTGEGEMELRIVTPGGMASPTVVLAPEADYWSCECDSAEEVCIHVAAAVIAVRRSLKESGQIEGLKGPAATIAYRLSRMEGALHLQRFTSREGELRPLETRVTSLKKRDASGDVAVSQADIAVDLALGSALGGEIPQALMPRLLAALAECPDLQLDGQPVTVGEPGPMFHVCVEDHGEGFRLFAEQDTELQEVFSNGAVLREDVLRPVGECDLSSRDIEELRKGRTFDFGQTADLVGRVIPALRERITVEVRSRVLPSASPQQPRLAFSVHHDGECLEILPTLVYGDPPSARVDGGRLHYLRGPLPLRDEKQERLLVEELGRALELELGKPRRFAGVQAVEMAERVRSCADAVVQGDGLENCFVAAPLQARLSVRGDDFELDFISHADGVTRRAEPQAVLRAWQNGERLAPLLEGGWAPLPQTILERCGQLMADLLSAREQAGALSACSAADLARLCEAMEHPPPPGFERLRLIAESFASIPPADLPADLEATLRGYQIQGVNWLSFLSGADLGALLADDMGLGKTIQALCAVGSPCLVVAPASVLFNWSREIERFRPALGQNLYHGPARALDPQADITLTTYAVLRLDEAILTARQWDTVILDEAQNIKNADSQVAGAAFALQARFRIALTGTPVENRLDELWSQFHFLNRGLLGGRRQFQDRYARPIADGDSDAARTLRERIGPFVLRRLKREVAAELPPRTEVVLRCTLDARERALYDAIHAATRKEVVEKLQAGGSVLAALEALLRLRQACCHPALIPGQTAESSSKLELLLDTLDKVLAGGHKALVFSQWTSLLDLIEPLVRAEKMAFTRLDGSTRNRDQVVDSFQDDSGPPIMLVSLKAGGTGLNLTAADTVFLLDPWWNPAVEEQAAHRTHRIGQHRPVLVQRLIAEDTVEQRILALQESKRDLARIAVDEGQKAAGLTREDLLALLS
jgi:superfamily II DNA or RNA helicase